MQHVTEDMFGVYYKKLLKRLRNLFEDKYFLSAFVLFFIGTLLRFYRLPDFVTFLGDQGRDAIIVRRILTFEHFPAIGAPTSVGQVYLGPFYYYFIAPWLLLFRFDPVGLAYGVAFFSSLFILIFYLAVKDLFDKKIAIISTIFITFSYVLIDQSRYSWNPNLLPLFSFLTLYFLIKSIKTNRQGFFLLTGAFLSFSIQLHYLSLFLIPALAIVLGFWIREKTLAEKKIIKHFSSFIASFIFFSLPLIFFDIRHNFLNFNNFIKLINMSSGISSNKLVNILESFHRLNEFSFNTNITTLIAIAINVVLFGYLIYWIVIKRNSWPMAVIFLVTFLCFGFYDGQLYPHYFGFVYPVYFVIIAYFINWLTQHYFKIVFVAILVIFIFFQSKSYGFLHERGSHQIDSAKKIAQIIYDYGIDTDSYRLTSLPERYGDYTYRYFLELWGRRPVEKDAIEKTSTLFVVCEKKCKPIGDPSWDVAFFAPKKIVSQWKISGVTIYKLTNKL